MECDRKTQHPLNIVLVEIALLRNLPEGHFLVPRKHVGNLVAHNKIQAEQFCVLVNHVSTLFRLPALEDTSESAIYSLRLLHSS